MFEILAFYWVISFNQNQQRIFRYSADELTGRLYDQFDNLTNYINLSDVADSLSKRNATLETQLLNYDNNRQTNTAPVGQFSWIPAKVISNSINNRNNRIVINKGVRDSIGPGMGVLTKTGPVGIVTKSTRNYSLVMSLLNGETMLSASLKRTNHFGTLIWDRSNPRQMTLTAIPKYVTVNIGDTVSTSGYSLIFPKGRDIGVIRGYNVPQGSNFYNISVDLLYDIGKLDYVYVVRNEDSKQLDSLNAQQ
jgi:rod shape-determining protein MreC